MANRLLFIEPNPDGREIPNPEDFSIYVELKSITRGRSIITGNVDGNEATVENNTNSNQTSQTIGFLDGTNIGLPKRTLTTNYTEVGTNLTFNGDNDLETLGIESINISFDSSYTPMINIKFIDVRGHSVLSKGNDSKYRMFFELPYPLFELTVQGYYGNAVTYCLHLTKWNANFNSETGNFEINADFIGYTYALLTDCLIGLMRACINTNIGSRLYNEYKNKYPNLITIKEFRDYVQQISEKFTGLKEDNENIKQLNSLKTYKKDVESINTKVIDFKLRNEKDFISLLSNDLDDVSLIGVKKNDENLKKSLNDIITIVNEGVSEINEKIEISDLKIRIKNTNIITIELDSIIFNKGSNKDIVFEKINKQLGNGISNDEYEKLASKIFNLYKGTNNNNNTTKITLIYFGTLNKEVNRVLDLIGKREEILKTNITNELKNITNNLKVNNQTFKPTIRNIVNMFVIHAQIFLESIKQVSILAEKSTERQVIIKDKLGNEIYKRLNIKDGSTIFPWPEYNKKIDPNGELFEHWFGSEFTQSEINSIPELAFTEELLTKYMDVIKSDDKFERTGFNNFDEFYPVSPLDAPLKGSLIKKNPYFNALNGNTSKWVSGEVYRCLLIRGFLGLGFSNRVVTETYAGILGKFEAENAFNVILEANKDKIYEIITTISSYDADEVIKDWSTGVNTYEQVTHPSTKPKLMVKDDKFYKYSYLVKETTDNTGKKIPVSLLPINDGFDGTKFFNGDKIKTDNELRSVSTDLLFTSDIIYTNSDNGSVYFKIVTDYNDRSMNPSYNFKKSTYDEYIDKVGSDSIISQDLLKSSTYENRSLDTTNRPVNFFNGRYKTFEIENILYDITNSNSDLDEEKAHYNDDVISTYFHQLESKYLSSDYNYGTYLATGSNVGKFNSEEKKEESITGYLNLTNSGVPNKFGKTRELIVEDSTNPDNENAFLPYVHFDVVSDKINDTGDFSNHYSLFGSKFYYNQKTTEAKAFLFLHSIPWQGVVGDIRAQDNFINGETKEVSLFDTTMVNLLGDLISFKDNDDTFTIKGLYGNMGSFIKAPKLWCAFIGGLLYRYDTYIDSKENKTDIISFFDENKQPLFKYQDVDSNVPKYNEYLRFIQPNFVTNFNSPSGISFFFDSNDNEPLRSDNNVKYSPVDFVILNLPKQAREEFKRIFTDFVTNDFPTIQLNYELFKDIKDLNEKLKKFNSKKTTFGVGIGDAELILKSDVKEIFKDKPDALKNYSNILSESDGFGLELKNNDVNLIRNLRETVHILNARPRIFRRDNTPGIFVSQVNLKKYLDGFFTRFNELTKEYKNQVIDTNDDLQKKIFNTIDDDTIKLIIYRTLASINTKWLGGELNNKCADITKIVDSFKFLDSSFLDIGDKYFVNPQEVLNSIEGNYNQSLFEVINSILINNDFNFIPLPTFINFKEKDALQSQVFTPKTYKDVLSGDNVGPSFVCVYTGQKSTSLNLGPNSNYPDDGVYIQANEFGEIEDSNLPPIFKDDLLDFGLNIPYFLVSYAKGNQSIFKNVKLDQREFTETQQSLEIIENLSQNASKGKGTFRSQNLYNVYQQRAYTAEVEMMGCATIQPMMYFQLNNMPIFRGAYLILNVSHSITENNMSTTFKGSRIKGVKTPIFTEEEIYMNILGSFDEAGEAKTISDKNIKTNVTNNPPIVIENTGSAASRTASNGIKAGIVTKKVNSFNEVLELVVNNLEGAYCPGGIKCGSVNSGETLWGLDRKNHGVNGNGVLIAPLDIEFWSLVDKKDKINPIVWNTSRYPKPKDQPDLYKIYSEIIKKDYDSFKNKYFKNNDVLNLVESDGRLYFNMVYAVFNGGGYFRGFVKILEDSFTNGLTTSDKLLEVFVNERVSGGKNAYTIGTNKTLNKDDEKVRATLIANTGVDIQKMVGLGPYVS